MILTPEAKELEIVLGVQIESKLNFENHTKSLCSKASPKLGALHRFSNSLDTQKKNILFNSIIRSQFSYCPFAWMFWSRGSNSLVNSFHEKAVRIIYDNHNSSYSELLMTKNGRTIHQQNINVFMKEIWNFENDLSPLIIGDMFQVCKINYNLRPYQKIANIKSSSVKIRETQLWNLVPTEIKDASSLPAFKEKKKSWSCDIFPCSLCKTYRANVGFL